MHPRGLSLQEIHNESRLSRRAGRVMRIIKGKTEMHTRPRSPKRCKFFIAEDQGSGHTFTRHFPQRADSQVALCLILRSLDCAPTIIHMTSNKPKL